jgi:hypothetical protein
MRILRWAKAHVRKTLWILALAFAVALGWSAAGFSQDGGVGPFKFVYGMVQPDAFYVKNPNGGRVRYDVKTSGAMMTIYKDGKPWLTIETPKTGAQYVIGDPTVKAPIIVLPAPKR